MDSVHNRPRSERNRFWFAARQRQIFWRNAQVEAEGSDIGVSKDPWGQTLQTVAITEVSFEETTVLWLITLKGVGSVQKIYETLI